MNAPTPRPSRADTCHREPDPLSQLVTQWTDPIAPRCSIIVRFGGDYHGPAVRTTGFAACSSYLVEQRLGVLQIGGIEPFGEPAVDGGEQVAGLGGLPCACHRRARRVAARSSHDLADWDWATSMALR